MIEQLGTHWKIAACATQIIEIFIMGFCFFLLAAPFMQRKKRALFVGAAYSLIMLIFYIIPPHNDYYVLYGIGILTAFLVMCAADRRNLCQKIYITAVFFPLRLLTCAMSEIIYDRTYDFFLQTDFMAAHSNMDFALYVGVCALYLMLEFAFMAAAVRFILKAYSYKHTDMAKKELIMLIMPSVLACTGFEILRYYRGFYISETGKTTGAYDLLSLLYYTVSVITIVVTVALYQSIKARQEDKLQNGLLAAQIDSLKLHINHAERLYGDIRGIRHDMNNHLITLERLYAGGQTDEARDYGAGLKTALSVTDSEIKSGNPVTDVILQGAENEAKQKGFSFHSDFCYPSESNINAFDLSVILNNALQNALEHAVCRPEPYISVISYRRNNAYMLEISNSFSGTLKLNSENGLPVTSKEAKDGHGYGLTNIQRVAEKYSGDIEIVQKDGEFRLIVMLMTE